MPILFGFDKTRGQLHSAGDIVTRKRTVDVKERIVGFRCGACERQFKNREGILGHLRRALEPGARNAACRKKYLSCKGCGDGEGALVASCLQCAPIVKYVTETVEIVEP